MNTRTQKILTASLGLCVVTGNLVAQVTLTNFYLFGSPGDGQNPVAWLVQGRDGNFYGTTESGGTNSVPQGTVFRISPGGSYSNLYSFGRPLDGQNPMAGLVQGSDGNFYGTTTYGGTNAALAGTVFRIGPGGSYSNLYSFGSLPDGQNPTAGLVQGSDGNFYGTTSQGGANFNGSVFRISPSGSYSNLYSFGNFPGDGQNPMAGLVQGSDGNFYGTTTYGGTNPGLAGTVFRISPSGSYSNLYSFGSFPNDGQNPKAALVQGSDGNFYGTTDNGGTNGMGGTVFRISPSGSYSNLYSFGSFVTDGQNPVAGLVQGSDGNFFGTTSQGSSLILEGTVFKLVVPLNPPANQISAIQVAGTNVLVTIPSVAEEFYQLQHRTSLTTDAWGDVVGASATSIGGSLTVTNFGGFSPPQQFYRFAITP